MRCRALLLLAALLGAHAQQAPGPRATMNPAAAAQYQQFLAKQRAEAAQTPPPTLPPPTQTPPPTLPPPVINQHHHDDLDEELELMGHAPVHLDDVLTEHGLDPGEEVEIAHEHTRDELAEFLKHHNEAMGDERESLVDSYMVHQVLELLAPHASAAERTQLHTEV